MWTGTRLSRVVSLSSAQNGAGFAATREGVPRLCPVVADGQQMHPSAEASPSFDGPPFGEGIGEEGLTDRFSRASSGWAAA